jgi:molybdate transport system substrate-binding protein
LESVDHLKRFALVILVIMTCLAACDPVAEPARTLTVFSASSLSEAFTDMGRDFEASHPGVTVIYNFGGSGTLRSQLEQGAAADIFASANQAEMDALVTDNLVGVNSPQTFLHNTLLVILPAGNPANIRSLQDLARPGIKLVLGDTTVPAGQYARQVLANLDNNPTFGSGFSTQVLANLVSNETNVKQVVAKVQLGEADAGIVYGSDAIATAELLTIPFPAADNITAQYPIAVLINSPQPDLAAEFIAFVFSADGQAILKRWGFLPTVSQP